MAQELSIRQEKSKISDTIALSAIEQVVMQGDLSKLNSEQRVMYYNKVCESVGLNPFTRPFEYILLNGKLTLYAKKDATEQLRKVNGISIQKLEGKVVDDLYIVVAVATTKDGRIDQATGAVTIGNLKGDAKANAIMKAETKAKRRVTLSISGMGWTDESEIESIPNAKHVDVDITTGEIRGIGKHEESKPEEIAYTMTEKEMDDFYVNFNGDKKMTQAYVKHYAEKAGITVSQCISNLQNDLEKAYKVYKSWAAKQKSSEESQTIDVVAHPMEA